MSSINSTYQSPSSFEFSTMDTTVPNTFNNADDSQNISIFFGELEEIRYLIPVLKSIFIKRSTVLAFTKDGLKISCEDDSRTVQANLFIKRELFKKYQLSEPEQPKTLSLKMCDLLTALAIFFPSQSSSSSSKSFLNNINQQQLNNQKSLLKLKYESIERIKLQVINGDESSMAYIRTQQPEQLIVYSMPYVNSIILDSSVLIDWWKNEDSTAKILQIKINDKEPWLELITKTELCEFRQTISCHSAHIEHYQCTVPMAQKYLMSSIRFTVRPLLLASKISLRTDSNGFLNMQFKIPFDPKSCNYNAMESISNLNDQTTGLSINPPSSTSFQPNEIIAANEKTYFVEYFIHPLVQDY